MIKILVAALLLPALPLSGDDYAALVAAEGEKQSRRAEQMQAAHRALEQGQYERAVELARNAHALDEEIARIRAKARVALGTLIKELVAKLDHDEFEAREAASARLRDLGSVAVPGLIRLRLAQTSPETRYRIDELLKGISIDPAGKVRQWATEASASSEYTATDWSAKQMTGPPDTLQGGDARTAWAAKDADGGSEWVRLKFPLAVRITKIRIHETYVPGGVVAVDVACADGARRRVWEGGDPGGEAPVWFEVDGKGDVAREIVIVLDTKKRGGWEEIDAVELIGDLVDE